MLTSMNSGRTRLMVLWFAWASVLLLIVFVQLTLKHYGEDWRRQALEWLLPTILPTTTLVAGVWASEIAKPDRQDRMVPQSAFRMAALGSVVYLTFVTLVIAAQPFYDGPPVDLMRQSALFLAPLQGVVGAFIGIFFAATAVRSVGSEKHDQPGVPSISVGGQAPIAPAAEPAAIDTYEVRGIRRLAALRLWPAAGQVPCGERPRLQGEGVRGDAQGGTWRFAVRFA